MNFKTIIENANTEWNNAFNSSNVKALAALYTENALLSPGNGIALIGRSEIESLFQSFVDAGVNNHTLEIIETGGSGSMIYQIARWNAKGAKANGEIPSFGGVTTNVLEQSSDGKWLSRSHVWNVSQ